MLQTPKPTVAPSSMTHFDKMAALTHRGFTALVSQIRNESFAGRKVIAGMVMKRSENDTGILVSLGTGEFRSVHLSVCPCLRPSLSVCPDPYRTILFFSLRFLCLATPL